VLGRSLHCTADTSGELGTRSILISVKRVLCFRLPLDQTEGMVGWPSSPLSSNASPATGQSKAVAEALLFAAAERHRLDIRIVRPSAISGHRISGYANQHDATTLLLSAMVSLGAAPDSSSLPLRWIPVDFVATAVIRLALAPAATVAGRAYNLMSSSPSLADAVVALKAEGFVLRAVPATDWPTELSRLPPTHAAAPLVESFARMDVGQDSKTEDASALLPIFSVSSNPC